MSDQTKMVRSLLNHLVNFSGEGTIRQTDVGHDAQLYAMNVGCHTMTIALGKIDETFAGKGVVYYPVYEIVNDTVAQEIGIFELTPAEQMAVIGPDGAPDIERLGEPLFYDEDALFGVPSDEDTDDVPLGPFSPLDEQAEEAAKLEESKYAPRPGEPWIAKFMKNNNYELSNNEGGGGLSFCGHTRCVPQGGQGHNRCRPAENTRRRG